VSSAATIRPVSPKRAVWAEVPGPVAPADPQVGARRGQVEPSVAVEVGEPHVRRAGGRFHGRDQREGARPIAHQRGRAPGRQDAARRRVEPSVAVEIAECHAADLAAGRERPADREREAGCAAQDGQAAPRPVGDRQVVAAVAVEVRGGHLAGEPQRGQGPGDGGGERAVAVAAVHQHVRAGAALGPQGERQVPAVVAVEVGDRGAGGQGGDGGRHRRLGEAAVSEPEEDEEAASEVGLREVEPSVAVEVGRVEVDDVPDHGERRLGHDRRVEAAGAVAPHQGDAARVVAAVGGVHPSVAVEVPGGRRLSPGEIAEREPGGGPEVGRSGGVTRGEEDGGESEASRARPHAGSGPASGRASR
jgi:hypothetical protein